MAPTHDGMRFRKIRCRRLAALVLSVLGLALVTTAASAGPGTIPKASALKALGGAWVAQGPGPTTDGQVEGLVDGEVVGAIHALATHPTDSDILWVGAVNGGIWKTTNATAASPNWTQLTDAKTSPSIGALALDPTDGTNQTLAAGVGRWSSFGRVGGSRSGILRSTNGGAGWTEIDGGGELVGRNISGIAPRGATIVISVNDADNAVEAETGIFRSTDTGASWTQISVGDGSGTGLPGGVSYDLASDPADTTRLFTSIHDSTSGVDGIYRSTDTGASWTKVSDATVDAVINAGTNNLEIAVGPSDTVFAIVVNGGVAAGVFRSTNGGASWTSMGIPSDGAVGIHPGGQGGTHLSIAADPSNNNLVYVGGDRQNSPFTNAIGANDFSGRLFRGDASQPPGSQWVHLTHSDVLGPAGGGTASTSAPHADSRDLMFDADGNLIEVDDGGIYKRTVPQNNTGDWFSINGDIQTTELHDSAHDAVSDVVLGGAQDTGTPMQETPDLPTWFDFTTGDGGDISVDDTTTPGMSTRYSSFPGLPFLIRSVWDATNTFQSQMFITPTVLGGGSPISGSFSTPVELNAVTQTRLIIGAANSVYESFDQGSTVTEIAPGVGVNGTFSQPVVYGAPSNVDILYVGSGVDVYVRTAAPPAAVALSAAYPGTATVRDITLDPDAPLSAFVADSGAVYHTTNGGTSWTDITGNLTTFEPGTLRSIAYLNTPNGDGVAVGAATGVFVALETDSFSTWQRLGIGMPRVPVFDLEYVVAGDELVAGTLGRGAFKLSPTLVVPDEIFTDGFESGDTSIWSLTNSP